MINPINVNGQSRLASWRHIKSPGGQCSDYYGMLYDCRSRWSWMVVVGYFIEATTLQLQT